MTTEQNEQPDAAAISWWQSFLGSDSGLAETFRQGIFSAACEAYLAEFGRLPGSARTSRLRKKRNSRILDWYLNEHQPTPDVQPEAAPEVGLETKTSDPPPWQEGEYSIENILKRVESLPTAEE